MTNWNKSPRREGRSLFLDWQNWTIGVQFHFRHDADDPLHLYNQVMVCLGPVIYCVRWASA